MTCPVTSSRAVSLRGLMSPNPTVLNTVIVKYSTSVLEMASLKLPPTSRTLRPRVPVAARVHVARDASGRCVIPPLPGRPPINLTPANVT